MMSREYIESGLTQFDGTEQYHRHGIFPLLLTDGVKWLCENADCYWLMDVIGSHIITTKRLRAEDFHAWTLRRHAGEDFSAGAARSCVVTVTDGNATQPIVKQEIELTDFPLPEIRFFACKSQSNKWVVMLPGEY